MSRKRFVKLLMSRGIQRNEARARAKQVQRFGSYQVLFMALYVQGGYLKVDLACIADAFKKAMESIVQGMREFAHTIPHVGIDLANGPDQTAVCPVSAASIIAMTADSVPEIKKPDSGKIYWFITDIWETIAPVPVTVTQDNDGLLTVKWQVTEDYAEEYEEIDRSQLYASEAEAWRAINEGR